MTQNATVRDGWFKSSLSFANGNCVEVRFLAKGNVLVRNSRHVGQGFLEFTPDEWYAFIGGAKNGEFDLPLLASDAE